MPADVMKKWSSINDLEPLPQRRAWDPHRRRWNNTTLLPNQRRSNSRRSIRRRRQKVTNDDIKRRYRTPIWDKYLLVTDLLVQTEPRNMSVELYQYLCSREERNFRRHADKMQFVTLRDWKTKYGKADEMDKLRQCWLDVVSRNDTKTKNVYKPKSGGLKLGIAPILEEFMHWKHKYRGELSMDRSYRWYKTEMRRVVKSPIHFTILRYLFDEKKKEGRVWRTLKFSWGYMARVKVCVQMACCDF